MDFSYPQILQVSTCISYFCCFSYEYWGYHPLLGGKCVLCVPGPCSMVVYLSFSFKKIDLCISYVDILTVSLLNRYFSNSSQAQKIQACFLERRHFLTTSSCIFHFFLLYSKIFISKKEKRDENVSKLHQC